MYSKLAIESLEGHLNFFYFRLWTFFFLSQSKCVFFTYSYLGLREIFSNWEFVWPIFPYCTPRRHKKIIRTLARNGLSRIWGACVCVCVLLLWSKAYRSNPLEVFLRKIVLKIYSKFTEEHPWLSVISIHFSHISVQND